MGPGYGQLSIQELRLRGINLFHSKPAIPFTTTSVSPVGIIYDKSGSCQPSCQEITYNNIKACRNTQTETLEVSM